MAEIALGGKRGKGRFTQVSDDRYEFLNEVGWRVKKFPSGYEQIIREGAGGGEYPLNRVVLTLMLGRPLLSTEHAHHKNEDTFDNRDENLELLTKGEHIAEHNRRNQSWKRACEAARQIPAERRSEIARARRLAQTEEQRKAQSSQAGIKGPAARRKPDSGVRQRPSGRWTAQFNNKGVGTFDTKEDAIIAYRAAVDAYNATR